MNDFDVMYNCRLKWCRELGKANAPRPTEQALAAYHRGFIDALNVALGRVIAEHDAAGESTK